MVRIGFLTNYPAGLASVSNDIMPTASRWTYTMWAMDALRLTTATTATAKRYGMAERMKPKPTDSTTKPIAALRP